MKKNIKLLTCLSFLSSATLGFCDETYSPSNTGGPYVGVSFDTVYFSGHRKDLYDNGVPTVLENYKDTVGFGGSLYTGWSLRSGKIALSPEIGMELNNAKNKSYMSIPALPSFDVKATLQKKYATYLHFIASYDILSDFSLNALFGAKYARFEYKTDEEDATPIVKKKNYNALGFTLGLGAEKRISGITLGLMLSHTIYQSRKMQTSNPQNYTFSTSKIPGSTQLSLRFKVPFSSF